MLASIVLHPHRHLVGALVVSALLVAVAPNARAADGRRPAVPTTPRPQSRLLGCSLKELVCVHETAARRVSADVAARALDAAERTLTHLRRLGLNRPLLDGNLGGSPAFDVYLTEDVAGGRAADDASSVVGAYDAASAFALVAGRDRGCALESDIARSVGQAALLGLDPGAHPSTLALASSQLATAVAPCATVETEAVDRFQASPEVALTHASIDHFAGESLWLDYLDETYGRGTPGRLVTELIAIEGQRTPPTSPTWTAEPDIFDVLRRLLLTMRTSLDEAQLGFAVARAFVGSRSDGAHLERTEHHGDLGRVRFDWSVPVASLPRRLRTREIEATGAAYLWLDTKGAAPRGPLVVVAECERTYAFRWAIVTVDEDGKELGRHLGGRWGEDTVQLSLASLDGVAGVLLVGAASGHDDRERPFDPEEGAVPTAACEVTLRTD